MIASPESPEIAWRRTGTTADVAALDAWCAAVGPAIVANTGAGSAAVTGLESLVIVTWNVHVGGGDVGRFVGDLRSGALTGGRPVGDFVLLLQEAFRTGAAVPASASRKGVPQRIEKRPPSGDRIDVVEAARQLGLHLFYAPSMRNGLNGAAEDRGNAILSTPPIASFEAIELPYEAQRRVAVAGTITGVTRGGAVWTLRLVSAHLDNRSRWTRLLDSFGPGRTRQAQALAGAVGEPVAVLGGDFNSWSVGLLENAVPLLRGLFPSSPAETGPTFRAAGLVPRRLDHLLFRLPSGWTASLNQVDDRYGSDHHPLLSVVQLGS